MSISFKLNIIYLLFFVSLYPVISNANQCGELLKTEKPFNQQIKNTVPSVVKKLKNYAEDKTLKAIAYLRGVPPYLERMKELIAKELYLKYRDFGHLGAAELNFSIRTNRQKHLNLNTGRPLIIIANHPLGITDGLAIQNIAGSVRTEKPVLLLLLRWIEKLMPKAVFSSNSEWGSAIPVDNRRPDPEDPANQELLDEIRTFNKQWQGKYLRVLRKGAAIIIFPAGQVSGMHKENGSYPENVYDSENSWHSGYLSLARIGKADIVFAHIDNVNSWFFYKY